MVISAVRLWHVNISEITCTVWRRFGSAVPGYCSNVHLTRERDYVRHTHTRGRAQREREREIMSVADTHARAQREIMSTDTDTHTRARAEREREKMAGIEV